MRWRVISRNWFYIKVPVLALLVLVGVFVASDAANVGLVFVLLLAIVGVFAFGGWAQGRETRLMGEFSKEAFPRFKDSVLTILLGAYGLSYDAQASRLPLHRFRRIIPDEFAGTVADHIHGTYRGVDIDLAEIGDATRSWLCSFSFPRQADVSITITPRQTWPGLSFIFTPWGKKIALEDPVFSRTFDAYATDEVGARYILTPTMMERLARIPQEREAGVQIAFHDDRLLMMFPHSADLFAPPSVDQPIGKDYLERLLNEIEFALSFIDQVSNDLKLNAQTKV